MTTPVSTYRLQITADFTLDDAAAIVPYLAGLGVGAVYCSPLLTSTEGSGHGYDTTDPTTIDPARGGEDGWRRFVAAARAAALGIVVDIVPNHLGIAVPQQNPSWWSVLRDGPGSSYASWYDVDWSRPITVPILADDDVEADLELADGELRYFEHRFPLAPGTADDGADAVTVHRRQHYRLIGWRRADAELSYRRFFAVNTLAGVRVEDPTIFDATHVRILRWVEEDGVDGLRVDHPDGLADPTGYLTRLREAAPDAWIVAEKILEPGEQLPTAWPIDGTTGYDAMTELTAVFTDPQGAEQITAGYVEVTGDQRSVHDHLDAAKAEVAQRLFPAERRRIAAAMDPGARTDQTEDALGAVAAAFEVYRTYLPLDAAPLDAALDRVRTERPDLAEALVGLAPALHDPAGEAAIRFQQLTGPVLAKGVEDTAWYRYNRFVALNEVGGSPGTLGMPLDDFHAAMALRQSRSPFSMTALSTHDTKRGEDVRARLLTLAEVPELWTEYARAFVDHAPVPDRSVAYLLAQTFAGVGTIERDRMHAYAEKAMREASTGTSWNAPDEGFESAVHACVDAGYDDPELADRLAALIEVIRPAGWSNALGQKLVQLTMPGVPDNYQGTECWDDSLVDPDNRRPVDFARLAGTALALTTPPDLDDTGAAKLWMIRAALRLRRDHPEWFTGYRPVPVTGPAADHLIAFDRGGVITLATRFPLRLASAGGWRDTQVGLPDGLVDALTGATVDASSRVGDLLSRYPVALLTPAS